MGNLASQSKRLERSDATVLIDEARSVRPSCDAPLAEPIATSDPTVAQEASPLHDGVVRGDAAVVSTLLEGGANVDAFDPDGWTALHVAVLRRRWDVFRALLDGGASVDSGGTVPWTTPLITAIVIREMSFVRALLDAGADPNQPAAFGITPLSRAGCSTFAIAELLIERGASVSRRCRGGRTPLHEAAAFGRKDLVTLLVWHGADVRARDDEDAMPEDLAATVANDEPTWGVLRACRTSLERAHHQN